MSANSNPLRWNPPIHYFKGERVQYRSVYANFDTNRPHEQRGTVDEDAPTSTLTGVLVRWDNGELQAVYGHSLIKLNVLDLLAEINASTTPERPEERPSSERS